MADKKKKNNGSLPEGENLAGYDYRSKEHSKKTQAPDGVSGDWQ